MNGQTTDAIAEIPATLAVCKGVPRISGVHLIGAIECKGLGLDQSSLILDPESLHLMLIAPCGCTHSVSLAKALVEPLIASLRKNHVGGPSGTH